jgi:hypothetical protein
MRWETRCSLASSGLSVGRLRLGFSFGCMKAIVQCAALCLLSLFPGCSDTEVPKSGGENWAILNGSWRLETNGVPGILAGSKAYLEHTLTGTTSEPDHHDLGAVLANWDSYSCQLHPVLDQRNGRKILAMQFFPSRKRSTTFKEWRSAPVLVEGGGYSYWNLSFDPEKREYSGFAVNAIE